MEKSGIQEILNALKLYFQQIDVKLEKMEDGLNGRMDNLEAKFNGRMDNMEAKFEDRFDRLEKKLDVFRIELQVLKKQSTF